MQFISRHSQICAHTFKTISFFKRFYLFNFRERERRKRNISVRLPLACPQLGTRPATQAWALTGNWTGDPFILRPVLNPLATRARAKTISFLAGTLLLCFSFPLSFHPVGLGEWHSRTQHFSSFLLKETRSFYSEARSKISNVKSSTMPKLKDTNMEQAVFL